MSRPRHARATPTQNTHTKPFSITEGSACAHTDTRQCATPPPPPRPPPPPARRVGWLIGWWSLRGMGWGGENTTSLLGGDVQRRRKRTLRSVCQSSSSASVSSVLLLHLPPRTSTRRYITVTLPLHYRYIAAMHITRCRSSKCPLDARHTTGGVCVCFAQLGLCPP